VKQLTLLLLFLVSIPAYAGRAGTTLLAIKGATLLDVRNGRQIGNSAILVEEDRIKEVGDASTIVIPTYARVIDARGKWVIPGLFDMHVHGSSRKDVPIALYVANGITAIRDMGGNITSLRMTRQKIESGEKLGPRLFYTGNVLDGSPPVAPPMSFIVDSPQEAKSAVEFLISQDADSIKIYNNITEPVLDAIVKTARRANKPVGGHVPKAISLKRSIELGFDFVEHSGNSQQGFAGVEFNHAGTGQSDCFLTICDTTRSTRMAAGRSGLSGGKSGDIFYGRKRCVPRSNLEHR
jgi:hypothetical protein